MKISAINFLKFTNKIYFSGIQNNNYTTQKQEENKEQLSQSDALTSRIYYTPLTFGGNYDENLAQKVIENYKSGGNVTQFCKDNKTSSITYYKILRRNGIIPNRKNILPDEELMEKVITHYKEGGSIEDFCKKYGITSYIYYKILKINNIQHKRIRHAFKKEQSDELNEQILQNHERGGDVKQFCKEKGIEIFTYNARLLKLGINRQKIKEEQMKELDEEILKNHEQKGNIEKFCQEKGILPHIYAFRLYKMGIRREKEQRELNEKILKNYKKGGDIKQFCQKNNINIRTYYFHLTKMGINCQEKKQEQQVELDEQILKNHKEGGNIENFCQEKGITRSIYFAHLRKFGIYQKGKILFFTKEQNQELNELILKNHKEGGDIKQFCQKYGINLSVYYNRLKKLGINIKEEKKNRKNNT